MTTTTTTSELTFYQMSRRGQYIRYEEFNTVGHTRYRTTIRRDSYDDQSYGMVEMFMVGYGWSEVLRVGLDYLHEVETVSYVELPVDKNNPYYEEKYEKILRVMTADAKKILATVLRIVGK